MKFLYLLCLGMILSSCISTQEIRAKQAASDYSSCKAKGFKPNTDAFRLCLDNRSVERIANDAKQKANSIQSGLIYSCISSGGVLYGNTCVK